MLNLVILMKFSETKLFLRNIAKLGDLLAKSPNMGPSHAATFSMRVNTCLSTFLSVHQNRNFQSF